MLGLDLCTRHRVREPGGNCSIDGKILEYAVDIWISLFSNSCRCHKLPFTIFTDDLTLSSVQRSPDCYEEIKDGHGAAIWSGEIDHIQSCGGVDGVLLEPTTNLVSAPLRAFTLRAR